MDRAKSYLKPIACLEGPWNLDFVNRMSVAPILEVLYRGNGVGSIHLSCHTLEELKFLLSMYKRIKDFGILHLAFHGFKGGIRLPDVKLDLESVAYLMGSKAFKNWAVFFDSCLTLNVEKKRVMNFMADTQAMMVIGFKEKVDWMVGAALDLLILDELQHYKDMGKFWDRFRRDYRDLVKATGLTVYHKRGD